MSEAATSMMQQGKSVHDSKRRHELKLFGTKISIKVVYLVWPDHFNKGFLQVTTGKYIYNLQSSRWPGVELRNIPHNLNLLVIRSSGPTAWALRLIQLAKLPHQIEISAAEGSRQSTGRLARCASPSHRGTDCDRRLSLTH